MQSHNVNSPGEMAPLSVPLHSESSLRRTRCGSFSWVSSCYSDIAWAPHPDAHRARPSALGQKMFRSLRM